MNDPVLPHIPHISDILYGTQQEDLLREEILADLLEASAARSPDRAALIFGERTLTYGELNAQADLVAARLIDAGVRPGQIVGLWLPRGIELLVLQAGIAKAGAAWLPVDEDTPVERLQVCLDDADGAGVLTCAALAPRLAGIAGTGRQVWTAEALLAPPAAGAVLPRRGAVSPDVPAYVIYTSGSTGKPKGILITQRSICHFLRSENAVLGVAPTTRCIRAFRSPSTCRSKKSGLPIWPARRCGSGRRKSAAIPKPCRAAAGPERRHGAARRADAAGAVRQEVPSLRMINLGGEMCPESLVERWSRHGRQMFNTYGPTEATVSASLARLQPGQPVTIGTPLPNYGCWSSMRMPTRQRQRQAPCACCRAARSASYASPARAWPPAILAGLT
jgi:non-ribosomal peptide synthetase component F